MNWFKKHKIITVLLVLVVIGAIAGAGGGNKSTDNDSGASTDQSDSKAVTAKIGEAARDGKFEFVVKSIKCGKTSVGSDFLTQEAQGQYCLLGVSVKNIGDEKQSLLSSNQYLFNAQGQKYSADDTATLYAAPDSSSWYSDINPGNSVSGVIVFDIPKDQIPTRAELHDSAFSGGVSVDLQQHP
jgi:hypothetical protein